jgi:hypothetical protein
MLDSFKLPGSSYEELVKIIKAYSNGKIGQAMSNEILSQYTKIDKSNISRNNGFLVQLDLVTEGKSKAPTELVKNLGSAYNLNISKEIARIWNEIIDNNEFLGRMISAIKIRGGMDKSSFISHILYSSGTNPNASAKAGANTIIEIFKCAGLIDDVDGKIRLIEQIPQEMSIEDKATTNNEVAIINNSREESTIKNNITININLNINTTGENLDVISARLVDLIDSLKE